MSDAQAAAEGIVARDLTAFQQNILVILSSEPMYGLAIKRELEEYYQDEVNHGRLYPNLDELVEQGLLSKSALDKRTNEYALTEAGEAAILEHLSWVFEHTVSSEGRAETVQQLIDEAR